MPLLNLQKKFRVFFLMEDVQKRRRSLYTLLSISLPSMNPLIGLQLDIKGIAVSQGSACSSGAETVICSVKILQKRFSKAQHHLEFLSPIKLQNKT
jgi:cysteine sulfinate desulfinase/cysteine desulfurase-like protein